MRIGLLGLTLLFGAPLAAGTVAAAEADRSAYGERLVARAAAEGVAGERAWQDLLHYRDRRFLPGRRSATRDPNFFNAEAGWRDPQAELAATVRALFRDPADVAEGEQHPQCRFVARRAWLVERLDIDTGRLPEVACERFRTWYEGIDPGEITLVFAAAYLGNPASMYGHTLLRVDPPGQREETRLLSYVINHAAATQESSGFVFAVRGLTGGYPGRFSISPYYEKVREYNSLESRDLWEYRLDLAPDEVERLLQHTWELRTVSFPYFFLYQNCSYRLLELLDVARPGMQLADRFRWWAIPTDTVRAVLAEEGMLREVVYRPALRTRLDHQLAGLGHDRRDWVADLAAGERTPADAGALAPAPRARVLEAAYDYLYFQQASGRIDTPPRERMRELLVARSQVQGVAGADAPEPPATRPDQGHGTLRLGLGGGRRGGAGFASLHWRPAYHDALDPPAGYLEGAHIAYGDVELRYVPERDRIELERLMFVDIESLNPRERLFRPWSWNIRAGAEQRLRPGGGRSLAGGVDGGGGGAWQMGDVPVVVYAGLQGSAWASDRLPERARAMAGPRLDLLYGGDTFRTRARARIAWTTDTGPPAWRVGLAQSWTPSPAFAVRAEVSREHDYGTFQNTIRAVVHGYF